MSGRGKRLSPGQPPKGAPLNRGKQPLQAQTGRSASAAGHFIKPAPSHEVFKASFPGETARYGSVFLPKSPKRVYTAQKDGYMLKEKEQFLLSNIWSLFHEAPRNEQGESQFSTVLLAAEEYFHSVSKNFEFYVVAGEAPRPGIYKHWSSVIEQRNLAHSTPKPGTTPVRYHQVDFKGAMTLSEAYTLAAKVIPSGQIYIDPECHKYLEMAPSYKEVLKTDVAMKNFSQHELIEQLNRMNLELSEAKQEIAEIRQKNFLLEKEAQQWKSMSGFHDVTYKKVTPASQTFKKETYEVPAFVRKMTGAKEEDPGAETPSAYKMVAEKSAIAYLPEDPRSWADRVEDEEKERSAAEALLKQNEDLRRRLEKLEQGQPATPNVSGHELARIKQADEDERMARMIAAAMKKVKEELQAEWTGETSNHDDDDVEMGEDGEEKLDAKKSPPAEHRTASQGIETRISGSHV